MPDWCMTCEKVVEATPDAPDRHWAQDLDGGWLQCGPVVAVQECYHCKGLGVVPYDYDEDDYG